VRKNITAHALLHAEEVKNISEGFDINFGYTSKTFEAELQLAEYVFDARIGNYIRTLKDAVHIIASLAFNPTNKLIVRTSSPKPGVFQCKDQW
ncbi:unnamed protein product, partial [Rhizopus stolonifer]